MSSVYEGLRSDGALCDAVLRVQDVDFSVHKVLLCKTPYFRALFTQHSSSSQTVYTIPGVTPEIMLLIIQFIYTDNVVITEHNMQELMVKAQQFKIMELIELCTDFLQERMTPDNCISIWHFTNSVLSPRLHKHTHRYIIEHFEEVVSTKDFVQLTVQELVDILGKDSLNVRWETAVYESVNKWINFLPKVRKKHIATLLAKVRLTLMTEEYIRTNVLACPMVSNSVRCLRLVKDALRRLNRIQPTQIYTSSSLAFVRHRLPKACLLATGGWSGGNPTNPIEAYDYRSNTWKLIENTLPVRAHHGVSFLGGFIYYSGGFDENEYFNTVLKFNPVDFEWTEVSPMHARRCHISVTVLNGCIYAMGGYNGRIRLDTAEFYRPETNQWTLIASMHNARSDASCAAYNNKIYICGGFIGQESLQSAECYNSETNEWTRIAPMLCRRSGVGVAAVANRIFAVGGFNSSVHLKSAEAYDPVTDTWTEVAPMHMSRSNFGIEVLDGRIFVVGGYNNAATTSAECYDAELNQWCEVRSMKIFRSSLSCCVIYGLPNMADYTVIRKNYPNMQFEEPEEED